MEQRIKTVIMGAAGRDFHNFNLIYRDNPVYEVICFTATQIPDIDGRKYPAELAGELYPAGIPIHAEQDLYDIIKKNDIEEVVFAYSDVPHEYVMHKAAIVNAAGAHFKLLGVNRTMLKSKVPVISVCAIRTGCGKSQTTRRVAEILKAAGKKVVAIRHPMPYGDLVAQRSQRFATIEDLKKHNCTIEEMEEYEPHIAAGVIIYAGVDYADILRQAEAEADVILWDGGNNDTPFYKSDLEIVVVDPHRPGHELSYYPGETNFRRADVIVINKIETAYPEDVAELRSNIKKINPRAMVVDAASPIFVEDPSMINDKVALVVEDGPTLTHGEMTYGAGVVAAEKYGASELVDPRPYTVGTITETFKKYPDIGTLLPAMGYGDKQIKDLEETINAVECDIVISATPIDLTRIVKINKPHVRVKYELQEIGTPTMKDALKKFI
ncbi:MAG: GTPase [Candidatus Wallbacteria bacterium HGW-Wallbacteria-1]|uniref:GTPase n=1 Tax=Candidatus Wallbacteria bacterium HGW-Wallbacteria-1 TaxID=2013854 RepID=A0A2N1PV14_9BACT|nr:MAG: GTPase [Candidatus Wallbacteria bacterium HGW-Wallbacteria-1]